MTATRRLDINAVMFDLGGVVLESPFPALSRYEERRLTEGFLNELVVQGGPNGSWARLERGELSFEEFCQAFDAEATLAGGEISSRDLMERLVETTTPRPEMLAVVRRLRALGLGVAALTDNFRHEGAQAAWIEAVGPEFNVVIESSRVGMRKPEPRIYELACARLRLSPGEVIYLDDIGGNLKTARHLGMHTIKVNEPATAVLELERVLGVSLDRRS